MLSFGKSRPVAPSVAPCKNAKSAFLILFKSIQRRSLSSTVHVLQHADLFRAVDVPFVQMLIHGPHRCRGFAVGTLVCFDMAHNAIMQRVHVRHLFAG
nr:MAG TPA: hypothetical protein [Caudoviricetes sp.]